ncbi:unnamed protein product [Periconia digitata]|uniref:Uncharacterized protein n=1 Tax=Periconia digitata TaxID=1303443 RepID=A0A9W4UKD0_9PLEO|nr:unnamed protein product [Periconia digitata]
MRFTSVASTFLFGLLTAQPILASPTPSTNINTENLAVRAPEPEPSFLRLPGTIRPTVRRREKKRARQEASMEQA